MLHIFTINLCGLFDITSVILPFLTLQAFISCMPWPYSDINFTYTFQSCRKVIIHSLLVLSIILLDYRVGTSAHFLFYYS